MDNAEVRLRILGMVIPQASRVGIQEPEYIVKTCKTLENYVLESKSGESTSDSPTKKKPGRPRKGSSGNGLDGETGPAHGGQAESTFSDNR
jgi:hypothetical protein